MVRPFIPDMCHLKDPLFMIRAIDICPTSAQCVHCTVGFPCSKKSPAVATGECS